MRSAVSTLELRRPRSIREALTMLRDDGPLVPLAGATLKVEVCTDSVVRIAYAGDAAVFDRPSMVTAPKQCGGLTDPESSVGQITRSAELIFDIGSAMAQTQSFMI